MASPSSAESKILPPPGDILQTCVDAAQRAGLDFLLIGGHAVNAHGFDRTTIDFDFLLASRDLRKWHEILVKEGYRLIQSDRRIDAFAQYEPPTPAGAPVDLMLVDDATFAKLLAGSVWMQVEDRRIRVIGALHLIALKLHALREPPRVEAGVDYLDILQLIRIKQIDPTGAEFQQILNQYAIPAIRERLLRDIGQSL